MASEEAARDALREFTDKVQRDFDAELEVTWDAALVAGWQHEQLRVTVLQGQNRAYLSATHRGVEEFRLVEVWLEAKGGEMALCVKRVEKMPPPMPLPPRKPNLLSSSEIIEKCKAIVERGSKPTLPEVEPLIASFYELDGNGAGGSLHVVLDDGNVQLPHIQWCAEQAEARRDFTGMWLARVLCMLSASQRRRM